MECEALLTELREQRIAFDAERAEWAKERQQLLNAALAANTGEFVMRQRATGLDPTLVAVKPKLHDGETAEVDGRKVPLAY